MLNLADDTLLETHSDQLITFSLYELKYSPDEEPICYTNWDEEVAYRGRLYTPTAIKHSDMSQSSDGKISDVTLDIGNADRIIQTYIERYDLVGKRVKIIQYFYGSSNGTIQGTFKIKAVKAGKESATFTLSIGLDYIKSEIPRRYASSRFCHWQFKSVECGYTGTDDSCEKTFDDCLAKGNIARIGCFPGIINDKIFI